MNHALIMPVLLPMIAGSLLLFAARLSLAQQRLLSVLSTLGLLLVSVWLLRLADGGQLHSYALGNWQAPFGIVLLLDRLSALMLLVTAVLALFAVLYAVRGDDTRGSSFHALFQFQLMGINGAFLTGDLFTLFVFFEILLIASYALLLHGGGGERVRAGIHYVVLNLLGSSLFLIAVGMMYGIAGTLNMADLAVKVAAASPEDAALMGAAGLLLLVVFGLKAAFLPMYFWLPRAYAAASAPVAALFAIMTKIGLYSIMRVYILIYGEQAGSIANVAAGPADDSLRRTRRAGGGYPAGAAGLPGGGLGGYPAGGHRPGHPRGPERGVVLSGAQHLDHRRAVPDRRPDQSPARREGRQADPGSGLVATAETQRAVLYRGHRHCRSAAVFRLSRQAAVAPRGGARRAGAAVMAGAAARRPADPGGPEPRRQHGALAHRARRAGQCRRR